MYGCMNDWLKNNILKKNVLENLQKKVVTGKNNGQILKRILNNLTSIKNKEAKLWKKTFHKSLIGWNFCKTRQVTGEI